MYEDRDLESFAYDRACLELSKQGFKTTLLFIETKKYSFKVKSRYLGNRGNDQFQILKKLNVTHFFTTFIIKFC